jgi:hypothetical protein
MLYSSDGTPTSLESGTRVEWLRGAGVATFFNKQGMIFLDQELQHPCGINVDLGNTFVTMMEIIATNAGCEVNYPRSDDGGITCELVRANPAPHEAPRPIPHRRGKR